MINFFSPKGISIDFESAFAAFDTLESRSGAGNDFLGWMDLPGHTPIATIEECKSVYYDWKTKGVQVVVVIGIGGSYLGAKAVIEALNHSFEYEMKSDVPRIVFAGNNLSEDYHAELLEFIENKSVAVVVISKSGTTTEPAVAFRVIREKLEKRYGREGARSRIVAVTDSERGALKSLSNREGYRTFVIPDNVGGRFSVLTPVGLLPIALAGYDIEQLLAGAANMSRLCSVKSENNPAICYAAARNLLYNKGHLVEVLVNYNPKLQYFGEWWKQLFGESEGKGGKGIFPASANYTTDLHSMGQYIQDGERIVFETVLSVINSNKDLTINEDVDNLDGLNFLSGKHFDECNKMAEAGTRIAHIDGGVPNLKVEIERIDEFNIGELLFFFEKACGISAYMLGVNPFDQPGVEAYKKNMFALLGKPGYEKEGRHLINRL